MGNANTPINLKNDSAGAWAATNPTLELGEVGIENNTGRLKTGDGITSWNSLSYQTQIAPLPVYSMDSTNTLTASAWPSSLVWYTDLKQPGYCDGTNWFKLNGVSL